jgi:hypothetical protein
MAMVITVLVLLAALVLACQCPDLVAARVPLVAERSLGWNSRRVSLATRDGDMIYLFSLDSECVFRSQLDLRLFYVQHVAQDLVV